MSVDRQQMLETAERLNQQMADGIPYTWETLEQALSFVTEKRDRGIHGRICYFAAFYHLDTGNQEQCLKYLDESVRCLLGTDQEIHVARAYNMIGIVAHMQNNLSLAMEQYGRALDYTAKYNDKMVHSIVLSNMADAYYLIGVYDRAVQCYRECIREFEKAGDDSIYSRINFRKMLVRVWLLSVASGYGAGGNGGIPQTGRNRKKRRDRSGNETCGECVFHVSGRK